MIVSVRKRDGREMPFNIEKIADAIVKAFRASGELDEQIKAAQSQLNLLGSDDVLTSTALKVSADVVGKLEAEGKNVPDIEEIQDAVEKALTEGGYADTAKSYILYRAERTRVREVNTRLMHTLRDITFSSAKESDLKRENANIDGDTAMGTMLKYGSESAKHFYTMMMLKPEHSRAHMEGDIHIHDLDFYSLTMTCCQIDLKKLFKNGFNTGHGHLREPKDIRSYAALAAIAIQSNQNDQHGGQSIPNFDYAMADGVRITYRKAYLSNMVKALILLTGKAEEEIQPVVKKLHTEMAEMDMVATLVPNEKFQEAEARELSKTYGEEVTKNAQKFAEKMAYEETDKATFQAMEAFVHNLNSMHSRAGAQTPFSSINYGMCTEPEARMAMRNLLLTTEEGLGGGETAIFPIQIFRVKDGISLKPGDPNYDLFKLACRVSAKRLFPNFSFQDAPYNLQYYKPGHPETEIAYMGCRTRVIGNHYDPSREISFGRGNLSFTSINLPRIAIKMKSVDLFFKELDRMMQLVSDQLMERLLGRLCGRSDQARNAFHWLYRPCRNLGDAHGQAPRRIRSFSGTRPQDYWPHARILRQGIRTSGPQLQLACNTCRRPFRPLRAHGQEKVRYYPGRYRPRLLHQLFPRSGVLQDFGFQEAFSGSPVPRTHQRWSHQLRRTRWRPDAEPGCIRKDCAAHGQGGYRLWFYQPPGGPRSGLRICGRYR